MRKRIIALLIVFALLLAGGGTTLAMSISDAIEQKTADEQRKAENERTYITELFHDQGYIYMAPLEPKVGETVTIRLRTLAYNVTRAQIQYTTDKGLTWKTVNMEYEKRDETGYYDVWKGELVAEGDSVHYRFIASNKDLLNTVYYDTKGVDYKAGSYATCWQFVPGHDVPDWAMGALWYNLMPDAFYNGNITNDKQISGWNTYTTWNRLRKGLSDKYGGDLDGIEAKLDYIASLGTNAIYMNPIAKSYQNAGYGSVHYDEVESSFGNEQDLKELAEAIHKLDMKLMGDVVLTFAVENSYYFDKNSLWPTVGAYESKDSIYQNMFKFYRYPEHFLIAWGSPAIDLNSDITQSIIYSQADSYLQTYAKIFDAYRFDCGGWLWGSSDTEDIRAEIFVRAIRQYLKEKNEDFFLLAEADWGNLSNGTWDAQWNTTYMPKLQDYAKGLINETLMTEAMYTNEMTIPRNVALALQNMICDHDSYRVVQEDDYMYNAAVLLQMTYLGAPMVFYGEEAGYIREPETGVGTVQSFYAMDWDASNWNMSRLNFYKSLGELRESYSSVKTGVVNMLGSDVENNTITYGRWDENGAAITVTSQNEGTIQVEIEARKCDIKNGTVLTDWLTGKQYVVQDGKVTVDVIPGGSVFVTGEKSSTYKQSFVKNEIGTVSGKDMICATDEFSFTAEGKGTILKDADAFTYLNMTAWDGFSVYGNIRGDGTGVLMLRNSLDKSDIYYAVMSDGKKLSVVARTQKGENAKILVETTCGKNTYVKLERTEKNTFKAYVTEVENSRLGTWKEVSGSEISINMDNQIHYGFGVLKGKVNINNVTFAQGTQNALFDTFDGEIRTALFDNINADFVSVADGRLHITNTKRAKNFLLTSAAEHDWTFKTKLGTLEEGMEYAGVVCQQNEGNYIIAGRIMISGKSRLFIGKAVNGVIAVVAAVDDVNPKEDVVVQLQRIGAYYSAVYKTDTDSWKYIGKTYANFSEEHTGIFAAGEGTVSYDYVSFGNSMEDGKSVNTPYSPVEVDVTYNNDSVTSEGAYEWLSGKWSLVTGGWLSEDAGVFSQASVVNQMYSGLYAEASIEIKEGDGWAGLAFGKTTPDSGAEDGFVLKYAADGTCSLINKGEVIAKAQVENEDAASLRLTLYANEGQIIVYAGQKPVPIISVSGTGYYNGYVSFCSEDVKAHFGNFHHGHTSANWSWISGLGSGVGSVLATKDTSGADRQIHSIGTLVGYGFTDFVCSGKLSVSKVNKELTTKSGLLLCASEGRSAASDGVFVYLDAEGHLKLDVDGKEKASYDLPENTKAVRVMVAKSNGNYKVFINGGDAPVLEYSEDYSRGGVFTVYTINGNGSFEELAVENLQPGASYADTELVKNWKNMPSKSFEDNFNTSDSKKNWHFYNTEGGNFTVKNGVLSCTESSDWTAGATLLNGSYSDYTMEFRLRMDAKSNGWMSVGLRKALLDGDHNNSGVSLMISPGGGMFFFDSAAQQQVGSAQIESMKIGEWNDIRITAKGSDITVYVNGKKMISYSDSSYMDGFISFTSGITRFSIDDFKITPMD